MSQITFVMVDMNDRLAQFMHSEQLTAAKLAEIVQVQPSSISHLLSGRNKPNFDFVARIMRMFPELNPDWLINGIGAMYRQEQAEKKQQGEFVTNATEPTPNLFQNKPEQQDDQILTHNKRLVTDVTPQRVLTEPEMPEKELTTTVDSAFVPQTPVAPLSVAPSVGRPADSLAVVRQVVLLFDDQTCSIYQYRDK